MAESIKIEIVSPENLVLSEQASAVTVPGQDGYFTVMGDHAPMMTTLKAGFVTVRMSGDERSFYVRGGFADVSPEGLTILAEEARTGADFNVSDIEANIKVAQEELAKADNHENKAAAQAALDGWMNLMMEAAQMDKTVQM